MMSQSHGVHGTFQFPGPRRIIKHKDAKAVSGFQSALFYAYGPLYEEIKGEANLEEQANLHLRQWITQVAWMYFVEQTRSDPDLMNKIKHTQTVQDEQIIMSENNPDLEGQAEWEGRSGDHQNATEQIESEDDEEMIIKGYYMSKIGEVIEQAKSAYDDGDKDGTNIDEMRESSFKYMMINHGCLFLLQMFVFLGLGVNKLKDLSELSSPDLDILFGSDEEDIEERKIIFTKSAVFPGNQIPLVVLNKLIHSSFFKKVVLMEDWKKPSSSSSSSNLVLKSVLYDLILDPVLKKSSTFSDAQIQLNSTQITDILDGLYSRLVGTAIRGDIRLQHGNIASRTNNLDPQGDNQRIPMNSVTEMYSKGMHFKGVRGMAIREINIKGSVFTRKVLHLPVFTFNEMTKDLYTCLKDYENDQGPREKVINDYLRFLRDIVRCDQDVVLLEQKRVIEVDYDKVEINEVVEYLREVACDAPLTCTTHHLRTVKLAMSHHHLKPWYYKYLTGALFSIIISIVSVTFGILGYFLERSRKK